jgi:hypothetical protein
MLKRLFGDSARSAVRARLESLAPHGWVAVSGDAALATALADDGFQVITIDHRRRRLRGAPNPLMAEDGSVPVRGVAMLIAAHPGQPAAIESLVAAVADGGSVILCGGDGRDAASQALAGGLTDIEQSGKLTVGRVLHFEIPA